MTKARSLISEGVWLGCLQGFASLGQLVGMRLLTEVLPPAVFGEFSLLLGIAVLVSTGLVNPTMQALFRYYPEYALHGNGGVVMSVARHQLIRLIARTMPLFVILGATAIAAGWASLSILCLLVALATIEMVRTKHTTMLNAIRVHRLAGSWAAFESWGRPFVAYLIVLWIGASVTGVLLGFVLASIISWMIMRRFTHYQRAHSVSRVEEDALISRFWRYTLPLLPLGIIGWISGMADRYMIGVLLSPADVGLYVAIYGLASRPMLIFGAIVESIIRPVYLNSLVAGEYRRAHGYLKIWTLLIIFGSIVAFVLTWLGHDWLAHVMLGAQYRSVSYLLPWIVVGYAFLILSYVANRVCYANEATRSIFMIEIIGAVLALVSGYLLIRWMGLVGAAVAIPIYYGGQLVMALLLARRWIENDRKLSAR
ncbi:lipopolysaccharide biosynthesis protein [Cupriavidus pinatubonensis]|uniref:lipopolysaccharide biosynthesis protein n=1 Tax=Cupriavidus pinatubonensis TaxID=248026 RepID=UPI0011283935|nr:oligosaccharide flippase family protein [Cupriavidus pinatubonensis]TPQ39601.1 hypothetical protein C2U69_11700 [Cupriavidus pinatubonensis]